MILFPAAGFGGLFNCLEKLNILGVHIEID